MIGAQRRPSAIG